MRQRLTKLCFAMVLAVAGTTGSAQESWIKGLPDGVDIDLQPKQLFFLFTSGTPKPKFDANNKPVRQKPIKEYGTGFAISDKVLITAKHVTRSASDFLNQSSDEKVTIPKRKVEFSFPVDASRNADIEDPNSDVWVTPSPVVTTDAARIDLDTEIVTPFPLSVCPILEGEDYFLLKFRQSGEGNAKNLNVPIVVPLKADVDVTARLGNLRRFEVKKVYSKDNLDRPIGGDSGSPVLDAKGQVIGLLSAIQGDSYLWVTPTLAFYDLVPPKARHLADCNSEVTFDDLNRARDGLSASLLALQTALVDTTQRFENRFSEAETRIAEQEQQIADLNTQIAELKAQDSELKKVDTNLIAKDKDLDIRLYRTSLYANSLLQIVLLEADKRGLPPEAIIQAVERATGKEGHGFESESEEVQEQVDQLIRSIKEQFRKDPVGFAVNDMLEEMSKPTWSFQLTGGGADNPLLYIGYERQIARPLVTQRMKFCLRPVRDFSKRVRKRDKTGRLAYLNPLARAFYEVSEDVTGTDDELMTACAGNLRDEETTKAAEYSFELEMSKHYDPNEYPEFNMDENASTFYGYVVDGDAVKKNNALREKWVSDGGDADDFENVFDEILHRMIFEIPEGEESWATECYYFPQLEDNDPLDDMAAFMQVTDPEEKDTYKCPTF